MIKKNLFRYIGVILSMMLAFTMLFGVISFADEGDDEDVAEEVEETSAEELETPDPAAKLIFTYEDLIAVNADPEGSYRLMCDIDLAGKEWKPMDFKGTFDGAGHAILNCKVTKTTEDTRLTYDGNMVDYDTVFSGFFGIVEGAKIKNLKLLGIDVVITTDKHCFAGALAGYTYDSVISNCQIDGRVFLFVDAHMIGVGGAIGFGSGEIKNSKINTTMVLVDKNVEDKDEQFMGGVNGNGFLSINDCLVKLQGYDSDHGYVHNGGLSGMYILYTDDDEFYGSITNNTVEGQITFFEDNVDRRAYCERAIGEDMSETYEAYGNEYDFESNEIFEYDTDLLPELCDKPEYQKTEIKNSCPEYSYTEYECRECGYTYKADYKVLEHQVSSWKVEREATPTLEGLRSGTCSKCNEQVWELTPKAEPETTTEETTTAEPETTMAPTQPAPVETTPAKEVPSARNYYIMLGGAGVFFVLLVLFAVIAANRHQDDDEDSEE